MTLPQALQYLVSGGAVMLTAALFSWLAENVPAFGRLASAAKQLIMVGVCLLLSLGAWAVQAYVPPATLQNLSVPFGIAVATVAALLVNQAWHSLINKSGVVVEIHHPVADPPADLALAARLADTEKRAG